MYNGMKHGYTAAATEHTCIVNMDKSSGAFTWIMWNGSPIAKDYERSTTFRGTFARGKRRVHVFVYGGKVTKTLVASMLGAWLNGRWRVVPLQSLAEGQKESK